MYFEVRAGSSGREVFWKIASPKNVRISRTSYDSVQSPYRGSFLSKLLTSSSEFTKK